jgi:hypothetical protein
MTGFTIMMIVGVVVILGGMLAIVLSQGKKKH